MYQRAGTIVEIHCRTRGILSIGNISPDSSIVGIISPIPEAIIAAIWVSTIVEIRSPRHSVQIRNRIETRASENRLPAIGTPITNTAQTMISTRSKIDSTRYGIALAMMIIIGLIGEVSSTSIEPVPFPGQSLRLSSSRRSASESSP